MSNSLWPHGLHPTRLLCPWDSPGKNTGVGCHALLQGIFPTQEWNPCHKSAALAGGFFTTNTSWEAHICTEVRLKWGLAELYMDEVDGMFPTFVVTMNYKGDNTSQEKQGSIPPQIRRYWVEERGDHPPLIYLERRGLFEHVLKPIILAAITHSSPAGWMNHQHPLHCI